MSRVSAEFFRVDREIAGAVTKRCFAGVEERARREREGWVPKKNWFTKKRSRQSVLGGAADLPGSSAAKKQQGKKLTTQAMKDTRAKAKVSKGRKKRKCVGCPNRRGTKAKKRKENEHEGA